ncbi:branched-chain amino acid ABC transporter permease [Rhodospirillaceae bacterium SYSU D60014]|jgi:branched-chain amino acid transport system permease protein|uniref:branched-chain amino acid ABC transporter permease n=1 Tax=Virgifigura deserti TaxID=2268457 RepID=UPI000E66C85A
MLYLNLFLQGLAQGSIYALIAVGLTLVYGLLRILHVAHAGLFALGAYISVTVTNATGSFPLAVLAAVAITGLAGMAIYRLLYEPILDRPPFVALIASIGLFIAMEEAFRLAFGPYGLSYAVPPNMETITFGGLFLSRAQILLMVVAALLLGGLGLLTERTRTGVAWRATVTDPPMAQSFGIDIVRVRYLSFFIGSALAAVAGVMISLINNLVEPTMGSVPSYKALAIIVLGGLGSVKGTLVAALALGVIEAFGTIYLGNLLDRDAIAFAFLILVLMLRPHGLFGAR